MFLAVLVTRLCRWQTVGVSVRHFGRDWNIPQQPVDGWSVVQTVSIELMRMNREPCCLEISQSKWFESLSLQIQTSWSVPAHGSLHVCRVTLVPGWIWGGKYFVFVIFCFLNPRERWAKWIGMTRKLKILCMNVQTRDSIRALCGYDTWNVHAPSITPYHKVMFATSSTLMDSKCKLWVVYIL